MNTGKVIIAVIFSLMAFFAVSESYAATLKEEFELQERCGKRAEEWFKSEWGNGISSDKDGQTRASYRNHYNSKLNKCFVLLTSAIYEKDRTSYTDMELFDVNEQKGYGSFWEKFGVGQPQSCEVGNVPCLSEKEWNSLVTPYMGD